MLVSYVQAFNDYFTSIGIAVEHHVAHVHTQNDLTESLNKRLQFIARPFKMRTKHPISIWGHAILYAAALIHIRLSVYHEYSPLQLVFGQEPIISISEFLVVRYIYRLLHHNVQRWVLKEDWEYMSAMISFYYKIS